MKCFYHSADFDGHCSGAIVKMKFPECEMIGINYGNPFPWDDIEKGETVFMVDFGLQPFSDMEALNNVCDLHWIDHHKTAIADAEFDAMVDALMLSNAENKVPVCINYHGKEKHFTMPELVEKLGLAT